LGMENVYGVVFVDKEGKVSFSEFSVAPKNDVATAPWPALIKSLDGAKEATLVFAKRRIYLRQADTGHIFVLMGLMAPLSTVRLNAESAMAGIAKAASPAAKGGGRVRQVFPPQITWRFQEDDGCVALRIKGQSHTKTVCSLPSRSCALPSSPWNRQECKLAAFFGGLRQSHRTVI